MSYTSFSIVSPGRAWDGVEFGSERWNELLAEQMQLIAESGGQPLMGGYAAGIGKFVNVIQYEDVEDSARLIARLSAAQLGTVESSGPFVSQEEWFGLMGS